MENMKKKFRKILGLLLVLTVLFTALPVSAAQVNIYVPSEINVTLYPSKDSKNSESLCSAPGKVTSLKTSDKSIVTLTTKKFGNGETLINLVPHKKGTTTVSFKYKGKVYRTRVTVEKYTSPVKSIKIGNATISGSKFKSSSKLTLSYAKYGNKKAKVNITPAKGWKIEGFGYWQKGWMKSDFYQNGKIVSIKGGKGCELFFFATNSKTGCSEDITITFK